MKALSPVFVFFVVAALLHPEDAVAQESESVYHSERGRYSISFPISWERREQGVGQGLWGLFADSPDGGRSDPFVENVNILIVPAETTDLAEANTRGIEVLKKNLLQFRLLDQGVGQIGHNAAAWFVHTFSYQGSTLKVIKYTLINGGEMYMLTCTALPETFNEFQPIFENIAASIQFDVPATPSARGNTLAPSDTTQINVAAKLGGVIGAIVGFFALLRSFRSKKSGKQEEKV